MPSAVTKKEEAQNAPTVGDADPIGQIKQAGLNKIRNLEKRKNKLETLRDGSIKGKALTEEQKLAVSQLEDVDRQIELAKEFISNVATVETTYNKQQKLLKKKEEKDKIQSETLKLRELLRLQDVLNTLGNDVVRQDFLAGNNGALKLCEQEMKRFDDVYKKLCPTREDMSENQVWTQVLDESAHFAHSLIVSVSKSAPGFDSTYKQLKESMEKLAQCSYFESKSSRTGSPEQADPVTTEGGGGEDHRRIEPTNSFDSSDHSATPSLYATNANGSNPQQEQPQPQPQRFRSPSDVVPSAAINFLQEDQTGAHPANVAMTYVPMPPPGMISQTNFGQPGQDFSTYTYAANQPQINSSQIDSYQSYNQVFPDLSSLNPPVPGQQQNQINNAHAKHMDQTAAPVFDSQQANVNYNESPMVSSNNANQKAENVVYNNPEGGQNQADSSGFPEQTGDFNNRGRGHRGGPRGGRGGNYRGDGFRGSGRGGSGWRGGRNEGSYDRNERGGSYGGGSYDRNERGGYGGGGGGSFDRNERGAGPRGGGYRRGGEYRGGSGGGYRGGFGGSPRGTGSDRSRGRGRGGIGSARGGGNATNDNHALVDGGQA